MSNQSFKTLVKYLCQHQNIQIIESLGGMWKKYHAQKVQQLTHAAVCLKCCRPLMFDPSLFTCAMCVCYVCVLCVCENVGESSRVLLLRYYSSVQL